MDCLVRDLFQVPKSEKVPRITLTPGDENNFQVNVPHPISLSSSIKPMSLGLRLSHGGQILCVESSKRSLKTGSENDKTEIVPFSRQFDLGEGTRILKLDINQKGFSLVGDFTVYL